ncbi:glycosyltransferase family 2 protein [Loktanella sp. SALINAS62]|uniref:glycosyltransferase family 2 protein n=1 Tax=Loktanella sp. SALINAS62 TaxID=2706124 RepID=UPI001B8B476B|nr:glycosyltransferase family 2 protein [Loktanella sp. SALINAS62]MBS1301760.1 glycosyltransferase family 2 protein [Loktanella sp. SALINAS62]
MTPRKLAVCAICRNERDYVVEWIAHYRALGFQTIHIYDNHSDDGTSELLAALHDLGVIHRTFWPRRPAVPPQRDAYNHFLETHARDHDYVLVCDLDEFLIFDAGLDVNGFLDRAEARHGAVGAIAIPWLIFGSSGQEVQTPGLVLDRFRMAADRTAADVKTIFNPRCTYSFRTHIADLVQGAYIDSALRPYVRDPAMPIRMAAPMPGLARIHHYYTKSRAEWDRRAQLPKADRPTQELRRAETFEAHHRYTNRVDAADRVLPAVRARISGIDNALTDRFAGFDAITITAAYGDWGRFFGLLHDVPEGASPRVRIVGEGEVAAEYQVPAYPTGQPGVHWFSFRRKWKPRFGRSVLSVVGAIPSTRINLRILADGVAPRTTFDLDSLIRR